MPSEKRRLLPVLLVLLLLLAAGVGFYFWTLQKTQRSDALVKAANDGNLTRVRELLDAGADPNARGSEINTETALMRAAANGQADVVELLLDRGADVNARHEGEGEYHGRTALCFALSSRQDARTVELLLARGADVRVKDRLGETPLTIVLEQERPGLAKLLVEKGADVNAADKFGRPALFLAAELASPEEKRHADAVALIETLLAKGANPNAADSGENTLKTVEGGAIGTVTEGSRTSGPKRVAGRTPLMVAAEKGSALAVQALLAKAADVNAKDQSGKTALQLAAEAKHDDVADLLKKAGAKE